MEAKIGKESTDECQKGETIAEMKGDGVRAEPKKGPVPLSRPGSSHKKERKGEETLSTHGSSRFTKPRLQKDGNPWERGELWRLAGRT